MVLEALRSQPRPARLEQTAAPLVARMALLAAAIQDSSAAVVEPEAPSATRLRPLAATQCAVAVAVAVVAARVMRFTALEVLAEDQEIELRQRLAPIRGLLALVIPAAAALVEPQAQRFRLLAGQAVFLAVVVVVEARH
jgi:uncharacterized protein involved in response to NO